MADFTLATEKAKNPGSTPGLKTNLLPGGASGAAGRLRAGYIDPNAARIGYAPAPIPERIEDQTSKGIQNFMKATADASFKYAEREAAFHATEANSKFIEAARRGYGGYYDAGGNLVEGYSSSQGAQAGPAYEAYSQHLDETFNGIAGSLSPRAKHKALIQMQSTKNQYLSKASTHRVTQQGLADEQVRVAKQAQVVSKLVASPNLLEPNAKGNLPVDPLTGMTVVDEFFNQYISQEEANADWAKVLRQVTETIYFESKNIGAAEYFLENIAAGRMRATGQVGLEQLTAVQSSLATWRNRELRTALDVERKREKDIEDYTKKLQADTYAGFVARVGTKNEPTRVELQTAIAHQTTDVSKTWALYKTLYGDVASATDSYSEAWWRQSINEGEVRNGTLYGRIPDGKGGVTYGPMRGAWEQDPSLNKGSWAELNTDYENKLVPKAATVNAVMKDIEGSWEELGYELNNAGKQAMFNMQRNFLTQALKEDPTLDYNGLTTLAHIQKYFSPSAVPDLETLRQTSGVTFLGYPNTRGALDAMWDDIEAMRKAGQHHRANLAEASWHLWQRSWDKYEAEGEAATQLEEHYNK